MLKLRFNLPSSLRSLAVGLPCGAKEDAVTTTAQDALAYADDVEALDGMKAGRWTAAEVQARGWSTSQQCLLGLAFGCDTPAPYTHPGDAWRRMNARQRDALRRHAPTVAKAAERASASSSIADHA